MSNINLFESADFTDEQVRILRKIKNVFIANLSSHGRVDARSIFQNPIYERLIGGYDEVNRKFDGHLEEVISSMKENFLLSQGMRKAA